MEPASEVVQIPGDMDLFVRMVAESVLIFAYCDEEEMDEDFAVSQLEGISHSLNQGGADAVRLFVSTVAAMEIEAQAVGDEERAERLSSMVEHLGLDLP